MRLIFLIINVFIITSICVGQPAEIMLIMEKMKNGQQMTGSENAKLQDWVMRMQKQSGTGANASTDFNPEAKIECPKTLKVIPEIHALTTEEYIALAKSLLPVYGPETGKAYTGLQDLLSKTTKPTDASDMAALLMMTGAGSAAVYCAAWSAWRQPGDFLTANTLGMALKEKGEFIKAIQVLLYADQLKPNVPLISLNLGWTYREMGNPAEAKKMFEKALTLSPGFTAPYLGLGMIAECEGNHALAITHLKKALADHYTLPGILAFKQARKALSDENANSGQTCPTEKEEVIDLKIPELPVFEQMERMQQQGETLDSYFKKIDDNISRLTERLQSITRTVLAQEIRAGQNPENSIVFERDFGNELLMYSEIIGILFGPNSNYQKALDEGFRQEEKFHNSLEKEMPSVAADMEKLLSLQNQQLKFMEEFNKKTEACGDSKCAEMVKAEFEKKCAPVNLEIDKINYRICVRDKGLKELNYSCYFKYYKQVYGALSEAISDFYAFTNPVLKRVYSPGYNEIMNINREIQVESRLKHLAVIVKDLPAIALEYNKLECIEPKAPLPEQPAMDVTLPQKKSR